MATSPPTPRNDPADPVARARTRARRRLVGAVVLLGIGIIAFPLVFETQPRPIPVDIPIEIPRKEGVSTLTMPAPRALPAPPPASVPAPRDDVITETRSEAGLAPPEAAPAPAASAANARPTAPKAAASTPAKPAASAPARPAASSPSKASVAAEGDRAQALLDGKAASAAGGGRFIVQVGAFADPASARETRARVEKLGLKTYTQVAETTSGPRTRVRTGPFATRDEADRALARIKAAGVDGVVLAL